MINKINRIISYILIAVLGSVARVHTGYPGCSSDTYNSLSQEQQDECIDRVLGLLEQCPTGLKSTLWANYALHSGNVHSRF